MFHTVYDSYDSSPGGQDYIGKHSTENPYDDYKGSFRNDGFNPDSKIVIMYSKTPEGAVWLEERFQKVFKVVEDPQYANQAYQTSTKFDRTGVPQSPETIEKIKTSNKETFANNPEEREKRSERMRGENNPRVRFPETKQEKEARLEAVREAWKDPALLERHSEVQKIAQNRPETKQKRSESLRVALNTPKEKERRKKEATGRRWYVNSKNERKFSKEHPGDGWKLGYFWSD
jgi:hypothetical protein